MREGKRARFAAMRDSYMDLETRWSGHAPFESWFEGDINKRASRLGRDLL